MNHGEMFHLSTDSGKVEAICGREEVALGYNAVQHQEIFLAKENRCPYCENILLRQENEKLKKFIQELKGSCKKIMDYPI